MNQFAETLQGRKESTGVRGPADLSEALEKAGRDVPEETIRAYMEGEAWVDAYFPGWVAKALDLDAEEMGVLASAVAYGQAEYPL